MSNRQGNKVTLYDTLEVSAHKTRSEAKQKHVSGKKKKNIDPLYCIICFFCFSLDLVVYFDAKN